MARRSFRDRFFTPKVAQGDDVAGRHPARRRRRGSGDPRRGAARRRRRSRSAGVGRAGSRRRRDESSRPRNHTPSASRGAATPRAPRTPSAGSTRSSHPSRTGRSGNGWHVVRPSRRRCRRVVANRQARPRDRRCPRADRHRRRRQPSSPSWRRPATRRPAHRRRRSSRCGRSWRRPSGSRPSPQRSRDRLRLLDARFDELIARAVEVSVGAGDSEVLGHDVDQLVSELESLRVAMEETDKLSGLQTQTWPPSEGP